MILVVRLVIVASAIASAFDVKHLFFSQSPESERIRYALYANSFGVPLKNTSYDYVWVTDFCFLALK